MTTWKCHDCESQFFEPETVLYRAGRIGNGSENWEEDEYIDVCPVCGSEEVYEAHFCAECSAKAAAYDEMVDRVKDALSKPIDMAQMVKSILTK